MWSWDITKIHGPAKWTYYYLYVILDIFSRYAVGWMLARAENADLAKRLIVESVAKQGISKSNSHCTWTGALRWSPNRSFISWPASRSPSLGVGRM